MRKQTLASIFVFTTFTFHLLTLPVSSFSNDKPSLKTLATCGKLTSFYISQEGWRVSSFSSCLRTRYGGNYIFYSAIKDKHLITWSSDGGNGVRSYTVISTNLNTKSYIQYEAGLGIRGNGFVNSLKVEEVNGSDIIPIVNILTVLEWEKELYKPSSAFRNDKCNATIKSVNEQIAVNKEINLRSYVRPTSFTRPIYLDNKPLEYNFSVQGKSASSIVRATSLLSSISSKIIDSCPLVSVVNFGVHETDDVVTYGLLEGGLVKKFQCAEIRKLGEKVIWGYTRCL
jgi:hypothetical protein